MVQKNFIYQKKQILSFQSHGAPLTIPARSITAKSTNHEGTIPYTFSRNMNT